MTMIIENVKILMNDGVFRSGCVEFDNKIRKIEIYETADGRAGPYLIPGLIDIHTHGALGYDYGDGSVDGMRELAVYQAKHGITSFLATTLTASAENLTHAMRSIASYEHAPNSAKMLGINMEGPFFSNEKRGAHRPDLLMLPDIDFFNKLYSVSKEKIKLVCVSPELDGAMEFILEASKLCRVSLAHSAAGYKVAMQGFNNGATHVTHLFNGMNPFLHRDPGIIGAALDANAFVEIISDGFHIHPAVVRASFKMAPHRVCLISDSVRCAGMPDGEYESAGFPVVVKNGKVLVKDGGSIAGSSISLMQGVRRAVSMGIPLAVAVTAATKHCAQAIGMENTIGSIVSGACADLVLLDSELRVKNVFVDGEEILL